MTANDHRSDDAIQRLVGDLFDHVEPLPQRVKDLAYSAHQMAALNKELAELTYDSLHQGELTLTRGTEGQARLLSFANDHLTLEMSLLPDGSSLIGEIAPVISPRIQLENRDGDETTVPVDEFGRFRASAGPGPIRIRVVGHLLTPWITR